MSKDIPPVVRDDAPEPGDFGDGAVADTTRDGLCAVDYDGGRYCLDCANPEYVELCKGDPRQIPYGGPVPVGSEVDCPGSACDNCLRMIDEMTVLHYDSVCQPGSCPEL
jgi:hypothetical protein